MNPSDAFKNATYNALLIQFGTKEIKVSRVIDTLAEGLKET